MANSTENIFFYKYDFRVNCGCENKCKYTPYRAHK